jgi:membrane protease YdiL (CAAX protease family)
VFAWGFDRSGSLLPGIVAHALNNSICICGIIDMHLTIRAQSPQV